MPKTKHKAARKPNTKQSKAKTKAKPKSKQARRARQSQPDDNGLTGSDALD